MKRVFLATAILLFMVGCLEKENLLDVDTDLGLGTGAGNLPVVAGVVPANAQQLIDDDPETPGVQATVIVNFPDYMDEVSLEGNVWVMNTTTGEDVTNLAITYNPDAKKLYVRHMDWSENNAYLLILVSGGVKNRWGSPIDGNGNGKDDGCPYDDALSTFYTAGSAPDSCVWIVPPIVTGVTPDTIRTADTLPPIVVVFDAGMDTTTLVSDNFSLVSETGSSIQLDRSGMTPNSVTFIPRSVLRFGNRYFLTITSSNVKADAPRNTPSYLLGLDADFDGTEADEPDFQSYFLCDTVSAPTVAVTDVGDGLQFDFDQRMDPVTLVLENIRAFDETGYVPGTLVISNNNTRVEYYFSRPTQGTFTAFVSKQAKSRYGMMLDGQATPNGIGGEPWDDFWWP